MPAHGSRVAAGDGLWVKPHRESGGRHAVFVAQNLGRVGRVRIVPPKPTWDILSKASAVVTVFGTTGFRPDAPEAGGAGQSAYSGGAWHAMRNLDDLPGFFIAALASTVSEDRLLDFWCRSEHPCERRLE